MSKFKLYNSLEEKKIKNDLNSEILKLIRKPGSIKRINALIDRLDSKAVRTQKLPELDAFLLKIARPIISKFKTLYFRYTISVSIQGISSSPSNPAISIDLTPKPLSFIHRDIIRLAEKVKTPKDVNEWSTWDIIKWKFPKLGRPNYIHEFKRHWVTAYHDIIVAAAVKYDLPIEVVGGVAYTEVGGDPLWIDDLAFAARRLDNIFPFRGIWKNKLTSKAANKTSFGNLSVQIRVAAKELGYDPAELTNRQRNVIIDSLEDTRQQIFISAKHLASLRDIDFKGVRKDTMTRHQKLVVLTRYNRGPALSRQHIEENLNYGQKALKRYAEARFQTK